MGKRKAIALGVEYDGSAFHGFQRQRRAASVQEALEVAVSQVADEPVRIAAAGRTDAGVHATQQVVSFTTTATRAAEAWRRGVSSLTPNTVGIVWAKRAALGFHARFDALWRRYVYVFSDAAERPVIHRGLVCFVAESNDLDVARMQRAAQCLAGEHDFSAFRAAGCQSKSPWRRIRSVQVRRTQGYVAVDIEANAFLLRMVRNIAGTLRQVGTGALPVGAVRELLASGDRTLAPPTAPPQGLYLIGVGYPGWHCVRPPPLLAAMRGTGGVRQEATQKARTTTSAGGRSDEHSLRPTGKPALATMASG